MTVACDYLCYYYSHCDRVKREGNSSIAAAIKHSLVHLLPAALPDNAYRTDYVMITHSQAVEAHIMQRNICKTVY